MTRTGPDGQAARLRSERIAACAAHQPHMPWTPPPGGVAALIECPACETRFEVEEGTPHLYSGAEDDADELG